MRFDEEKISYCLQVINMTKYSEKKNGIGTAAEIATSLIYRIKKLQFQKASIHFIYLYTHTRVYIHTHIFMLSQYPTTASRNHIRVRE